MAIAVAAAAAAAAEGAAAFPLPVLPLLTADEAGGTLVAEEAFSDRDSRKVLISTFTSAWQRIVKFVNMRSMTGTLSPSPIGAAAPPPAAMRVDALVPNAEANAGAIKGANRSSRNTSAVNADTNAGQLSGTSKIISGAGTEAAAPPSLVGRVPPSRDDDLELAVDVRLPGRLFAGLLPVEDDAAGAAPVVVALAVSLLANFAGGSGAK